MLSIFRRGIVSKIMLGVLAIGLFAIVITGFGTDGMGGLGSVGGGGGGTIARAGDEKITAAEMQDQVDRQLTRAREQQPELDISTFLGTGAFEEILKQLLSSKALRSFADNLGFGVSKLQVDTQIANIPVFRNQAGQFDNTIFRQQLAQQNVTEEQLRDDIETGLLQQQLLAPIAAGARIPEGMALNYASLLLERRTGSVGLVPASAFGVGPAPTTAQLQAFYRQNARNYTVPERRVIRYAFIGPERVANAGQVTPQEVEAFYRQNAATYAGSETRTLSQVVLPNQQAAQTFAAKLARGTGFDQAAAEAGFSRADTSIGQQSRQQLGNIASAAVATAAFAAAQGATTQPVQSEFGWHIVRVDQISRTAARTLDQARAEIQQQLSTQKRQTALADLVTKVEDQIADGSTIDEVARSNGLQLRQSPPVTASGNLGSGTGSAPAELAPLLQQAFQLNADEDPVVQSLNGGQSYALMTLGEITPSAPAPLAQVVDRVRTDFIVRRGSAQARNLANAILKKVNAGTPIAQAFAQSGAKLPPVQQVDGRRIDIVQGGQVPPPLSMLFSMSRGKAKLLPAPEAGGFFVVHLATTQPGNAAGQTQIIADTRSELSRAAGDELVRQFVTAIERSEKVTRDEDAIRALKQRIQTGAAPAQ